MASDLDLSFAEVVMAIAQVVARAILVDHSKPQAVSPEADSSFDIACAHTYVHKCGAHIILLHAESPSIEQ